MRETDVFETIEAAYSAATNPAEWDVALTMISDLLGGFDATLEVHTTDHQIPLSFLTGNRIPPDGAADYIAHYSKVCPRLDVQRYRNMINPGYVGFDYDLMTEMEINGNEFYSDFLMPHGLRYFISATLDRQGETYTGLFVHRTPTQGHVGDDEVSTMRQIMPHVTSAFDIHRRLELQQGQQLEIEAALECLESGALLLDQAGNVLFANGTAHRILNAADGLSVTDGTLGINDVMANHTFGKILKSMFSKSFESQWEWGGDLYIPDQFARWVYRVSVRRLPKTTTHLINQNDGVAIVFITNLQSNGPITKDALIAYFGLTGAEADVALEFAKTGALAKVARNRAVSINTVRSQLYAVMDKLNVHDQANLMRFLLSPSSILN